MNTLKFWAAVLALVAVYYAIYVFDVLAGIVPAD